MDTQKTSLQGVMILGVVTVSIMGLGGYGYYYVNSQHKKIEVEKAEITDLKEKQQALDQRLTDSETANKTLSDENQSLKDVAKKFESEKTAILTQVRSSVSSFESFRTQATEEIARLNNSTSALEAQKKNLTSRLQSVEKISISERQKLTKDIVDLNQKIDNHKAMEATLVENLKNKDTYPVVEETAKLHYNLGNFYFRNRDYKNASNEYQKALYYAPDDPDAHFNLAIVSDEYLGRIQMAVIHYKKYLELKPDAKDLKKIQQRVMDLEWTQKVMLDSPPPTVNKEPFESKNEVVHDLEFLKDKK